MLIYVVVTKNSLCCRGDEKGAEEEGGMAAAGTRRVLRDTRGEGVLQCHQELRECCLPLLPRGDLQAVLRFHKVLLFYDSGLLADLCSGSVTFWYGCGWGS
jgi:hypothetical protein